MAVESSMVKKSEHGMNANVSRQAIRKSCPTACVII